MSFAIVPPRLPRTPRTARSGSRILRTLVTATLALLAGTGSATAQAGPGEAPVRKLRFAGMVDAGLMSGFGSFDEAVHRSGLEVDLATRLQFAPALNAELRTTFRDGNVPEAGEGAGRPALRYDGAQVNWRPREKTVVMVGDLVGSAGTFRYRRFRRSSPVVGEHSLRGAGLRHGSIIVHAGVASDTAGHDRDVSVFAKWTRPMGPEMTWSPAFRYTFGIPGAHPFELGVSFNGNVEEQVSLNAHVGMNYWNAHTDPGSFFLVEPRMELPDGYYVAATLFYSDKGEVPSPNAPRYDRSWLALDDFILHVEPGYALTPVFTAALGLEFRDRSLDRSGDASLWMTPTLYVQPAPGARWTAWTGLEKPLRHGDAGSLRVALGTELTLVF